jgi:polysaccharide biosynthesis transport protein
MELQNYLTILWRRKWIVAMVAAATLIVVVVGTLLITPLYQASTTLRIATAPQGSADYLSYDLQYADRLMNTYVKIATSAPLLDQLDKKLGIARPPKITVNPSANTELMEITVEDPNPVLATQAANGLADLLIANVRNSDFQNDQATEQMLGRQVVTSEAELTVARQQYQAAVTETPQDKGKIDAADQVLQAKQQAYVNLLALLERVRTMQGVRTSTVSIVEPASVPQAPSWPRKELNFALGLLIGLVGGVGLAFLAENLDSTLYTTAAIQKVTELPLLGRIPVGKQKLATRFLNGTSPEGEAFRHVRTHLLNLAATSSLHTLLVTSTEPGEGKSTIGSNLAYSLAQSGKQVLMIDCDMRRPNLHKIFDLPNKVGLSSLLSQEANLEQVVQKSTIPGLAVIPSGPVPTNPTELLGSPQMKTLLIRVAPNYDLVLLDSTSLLAVTDALILAPAVDGVIMVVARAHVRESAARAACELLGQAKARSIGVIVNRAEQVGQYSYYGSRKRS